MNPAAFLGCAGDCSRNALGMAGRVIETHEHAGEFRVRKYLTGLNKTAAAVAAALRAVR